MKLYRFLFLTFLIMVNYAIAKASSLKPISGFRGIIYSKKNESEKEEDFTLDKYLEDESIIVAGHRSHSSHSSHSSHRSGSYHKSHVSHTSHRSASNGPSGDYTPSSVPETPKTTPEKVETVKEKSNYEIALDFLKRKKYANAKFFFESAINDQPEDWKRRYKYAFCLYRLKNYVSTLEALNKALPLAKSEENKDKIKKAMQKISNYELACDFLNKKEYAKSEQYFEKALHETPDDWSVLYWYAMCLFHSGKYEEALKLLKKAKAIAADDEEKTFMTLEAEVKIKKLIREQNGKKE